MCFFPASLALFKLLRSLVKSSPSDLVQLVQVDVKNEGDLQVTRSS